MQLFAIGAGVCVMFKEAIEWLLSNILPWISYVVGPVIAVVSFYFNRLDRRELMAQAEALGKLKEEVRQSERRLSEKDRELSTAVAKNEDRSREIDKLEDNLRQVTTGASTLWKLKPNRPFDRYKEWMHDPKGARILTIGNLKGGVGKTTLAANLAAYISEERRLPVLLVDLDYQGSLSSLALLAAGKTEAESPINQLFDPNATLATLIKNEIHLAPKLTQGWLIGANYTLAQQENELLFKWVMESDSVIDVRYRLAHLFLNPDVRRKYAAIIFDMPPPSHDGPPQCITGQPLFRCSNRVGQAVGRSSGSIPDGHEITEGRDAAQYRSCWYRGYDDTNRRAVGDRTCHLRVALGYRPDLARGCRFPPRPNDAASCRRCAGGRRGLRMAFAGRAGRERFSKRFQTARGRDLRES